MSLLADFVATSGIHDLQELAEVCRGQRVLVIPVTDAVRGIILEILEDYSK